MQDAEEDSFVPSDYDELDLMSDSNIENTSDSDSDSGGDNCDRNLVAPNQPNNNWTIRGNARNRFNFTGQPGLQISIDEKENPLSFFNLFFDDSLIGLIVEQTNLYANQILEESRSRQKKRSRMKSWKKKQFQRNETLPCFASFAGY